MGKDDKYDAAEAQERLEAGLRGGLNTTPQPLKAKTKSRAKHKTCPECGHVFRGNGWDGIDAHWRARHEDKMPYEDAWPLIAAGKYER